jgi:hypothetical protein
MHILCIGFVWCTELSGPVRLSPPLTRLHSTNCKYACRCTNNPRRRPTSKIRQEARRDTAAELPSSMFSIIFDDYRFCLGKYMSKLQRVPVAHLVRRWKTRISEGFTGTSAYCLSPCQQRRIAPNFLRSLHCHISLSR